MNNIPLQQKIAQIIEKDATYPEEAYEFVTNVIHFATKNNEKKEDASRHIGAKKIIKASVDYALNEYGFFAQEVLLNFNIIKAIDIGNIVFNLIEVELLRQSDDDSLEDFNFECNILNSIEQHKKKFVVRSDEIPTIG